MCRFSMMTSQGRSRKERRFLQTKSVQLSIYASRHHTRSQMFSSLTGAVDSTIPTAETLRLSGVKLSPRMGSALSWVTMLVSSQAACKTFFCTKPVCLGCENVWSSQRRRSVGRRLGKPTAGASSAVAMTSTRTMMSRGCAVASPNASRCSPRLEATG